MISEAPGNDLLGAFFLKAVKMKKTNIVFSLISIAFASAILIITSSWPASRDGVPGPAVFPRIIACIIICCALVVLIRTLLSKKEDTVVRYATRDCLGVYITKAALIVYFLLMKYLGFIIDTVIMLTCFFAWFSKKRLVTCILIAVVSSLVIFVIFSKGLNVSMRYGLLYF